MGLIPFFWFSVSQGMSQLEMYIIDLVEDQHREPEEEEKISSSSQRKRLLGTVRKPIKVGI